MHEKPVYCRKKLTSKIEFCRDTEGEDLGSDPFAIKWIMPEDIISVLMDEHSSPASSPSMCEPF